MIVFCCSLPARVSSLLYDTGHHILSFDRILNTLKNGKGVMLTLAAMV